jgi:hypothetical protein
MESAEKTEELESGIQNHRAVPRHGVDEEAHLLLVSHGSTITCQVVDFSQGGCCLRTREPFTAGCMVSVEVTFKVHGLAFRFSGTTQWTDGRNLVGIRFVGVPLRRREELDEAIREVAAENAAKAAQQAAEKRAAEEQAAAQEAAAASVAQQAEEEAQRQTTVEISALAIVDRAHPLPEALPVSQATPNKRDRRVELRKEVDTSAVIDLVKIALQLRGSILDISLSGCRIRTGERFPAGLYTWVETEFRHKGQSFRLGGVVRTIYDQHTVGIHFLYRSSRLREQVKELIEDILEMRKRE